MHREARKDTISRHVDSLEPHPAWPGSAPNPHLKFMPTSLSSPQDHMFMVDNLQISKDVRACLVAVIEKQFIVATGVPLQLSGLCCSGNREKAIQLTFSSRH